MLTKSMRLRINDSFVKDLVNQARKTLSTHFASGADGIFDIKKLESDTHNLEELMKSFNAQLSVFCDEIAQSTLIENQNMSRLAADKGPEKESQMRTLDHMADSYTKQADFYTEELQKLNAFAQKIITEGGDLWLSKEIEQMHGKIKSLKNSISKQKRQMNSFWDEQERHFAESKCSSNEGLFRLKYFEIKNEGLGAQICRLNEAKEALKREKEKLATTLDQQKAEARVEALQDQAHNSEKYESVAQLLNKNQKDFDFVSKKHKKALRAAELEIEALLKQQNVLKKNITEVKKILLEQSKVYSLEEKKNSLAADSLSNSIVNSGLKSSQNKENKRTSRLSSKLRESLDQSRRMSKSIAPKQVQDKPPEDSQIAAIEKNNSVPTSQENRHSMHEDVLEGHSNDQHQTESLTTSSYKPNVESEARENSMKDTHSNTLAPQDNLANDTNTTPNNDQEKGTEEAKQDDDNEFGFD